MTATWTAPRTWTAGEKFTASIANTHIRDNLEYVKSVIDVSGLRIALLADVKTVTGGGAFETGAWRTRDLNTEISDTTNIVTLSSNKFKPIAGTYLVMARAPAVGTSVHTAIVVNVTTNTHLLRGSNAYSPSSDAQTDSHVDGIITCNGTDEFSVQHYAAQTNNTNGFGIAFGSGGAETYTTVTLIKLS